jgi:hypothetical protein
MKQADYRIELRAVPGNWLTPPEQRLRAALKRLLRNYGLRATRCEPINFQGKDALGNQTQETTSTTI